MPVLYQQIVKHVKHYGPSNNSTSIEMIKVRITVKSLWIEKKGPNYFSAFQIESFPFTGKML